MLDEMVEKIVRAGPYFGTILILGILAALLITKGKRLPNWFIIIGFLVLVAGILFIFYHPPDFISNSWNSN